MWLGLKKYDPPTTSTRCTPSLSTVARIAVMLTFCLLLVVVLTWAERKGAAYMQDRRGPNRARILGFTVWGLFHPLADAIKFLFKEDFIPDGAHRLFYQMAPMFALAPAR